MFLRLLPVREMPSVAVVPKVYFVARRVAIRGDEVADQFLRLAKLLILGRAYAVRAALVDL